MLQKPELQDSEESQVMSSSASSASSPLSAQDGDSVDSTLINHRNYFFFSLDLIKRELVNKSKKKNYFISAYFSPIRSTISFKVSLTTACIFVSSALANSLFLLRLIFRKWWSPVLMPAWTDADSDADDERTPSSTKYQPSPSPTIWHGRNDMPFRETSFLLFLRPILILNLMGKISWNGNANGNEK